MIRVGLVDFDTSHVVAFTQRLNHIDIAEDQWVDGAKVVMGYPGTSLVSPDRIAEYTGKLRGYGVEIANHPEELIGKIDAVMVESNDGSVHLERALPFIEAGLPIFVDKPFATSVHDARALVESAQRKGVPIMSSSALRYTLEIQDIAARREELGAIDGCDAVTPAMLHPRNPGLFHYGVHGVEMVYALLGTGCVGVRCISNEDGDIVVGRWADNRLATVRGIRRGFKGFAISTVCEKGIVATKIDGKYFYREMLKRIVEMFATGKSPISSEELVEVVAFQEAAIRSAGQSGGEVLLSALE